MNHFLHRGFIPHPHEGLYVFGFILSYPSPRGARLHADRLAISRMKVSTSSLGHGANTRSTFEIDGSVSSIYITLASDLRWS